MGGCSSLAPLCREARGGGRLRVPSALVPRPKRRGFTGGTWFRPSDRARPALRCRNGVSAETPAIEKGSCQGRQALTEGLWVSCRNGITVTDNLLLHRAYNPSASHPLSTSPYTGEARGGRMQPARAALPGGKRWWDAARSRRFAGRQEVVAVSRSSMIIPHPTARPRPPPGA